MKIQDIVEARRNPAQNPKPPTWPALEPYWGRDLYLHFNQIEKVGVNLKSTNTWGPWGVYTFPIGFIEKNPAVFRWAANYVKGGFLHILEPKPGIRVLDLGQISKQDIVNLSRELAEITGTSPDIAQGSPKDQWRDLLHTVSSGSRGGRPSMSQRPQTVLNKILRRAGYDALRDEEQLLNDNPNQQVFLHGAAYTVLKTMPLRLSREKP